MSYVSKRPTKTSWSNVIPAPTCLTTAVCLVRTELLFTLRLVWENPGHAIAVTIPHPEYLKVHPIAPGCGTWELGSCGQDDEIYTHMWDVCLVIEVELCIVYFKWYDTYPDTHEAIFDMYQFCLILDQKNLIYPQISWEFGYFNDQNILNLSKSVSFEVSCN